ncbi:uncharacterized protein LOC131158709 [Malania oleifera]|uniref:uncharacterized protein LOC131158709 n=1 Tax=Malania oleifera TaxID=397392 RepID=UPI0025ADA78E|nr:uncharacterized protein LOC131158709 [Malania oleifera]
MRGFNGIVFYETIPITDDYSLRIVLDAHCVGPTYLTVQLYVETIPKMGVTPDRQLGAPPKHLAEVEEETQQTRHIDMRSSFEPPTYETPVLDTNDRGGCEEVPIEGPGLLFTIVDDALDEGMNITNNVNLQDDDTYEQETNVVDLTGEEELPIRAPRWDESSELSREMLFGSKDQLIVAMQMCKEFDCRWRVRAMYQMKHRLFEITQYGGPHTCLNELFSQDQNQIISSLVAREIVNMIRGDTSTSIATLKEFIDRHFGYSILYKKVWLGKQKVIAQVFSDLEMSYQTMSKWMEAMCAYNPRTIVKWRWTPVPNSENIATFVSANISPYICYCPRENPGHMDMVSVLSSFHYR